MRLARRLLKLSRVQMMIFASADMSGTLDFEIGNRNYSYMVYIADALCGMCGRRAVCCMPAQLPNGLPVTPPPPPPPPSTRAPATAAAAAHLCA